MQTHSSPSFPPPDSVQQMRDALSRGAALHLARELEATIPDWRRIEVPKTDAASWEDTEMDVRRVVL